ARAARGLGPPHGLTAPTPRPPQVPPVGAPAPIQVNDHTPSYLDPPVLAFAAVLPPAALDPPPPDHIADLVAAAAPDERRRHPGVPLHRHQVLVELAHRPSPPPGHPRSARTPSYLLERMLDM